MRTEPKVLDAKGNPLSVGARVKLVDSRSQQAGEVKAIGEIAAVRAIGATVEWPPFRRRFRPARCHYLATDGDRCTVLELIDQYDKRRTDGED